MIEYYNVPQANQLGILLTKSFSPLAGYLDRNKSTSKYVFLSNTCVNN